MEELVIPLMTAGVGFFSFVVGQFVIRLVVDPIIRYRALVGEIHEAMIYYRHLLSNPLLLEGSGPFDYGDYREAAVAIRGFAAKFSACVRGIPFRPVLRVFRGLPDADACKAVVSALVGMSNGLVTGSSQMIKPLVDANYDRHGQVLKILKLD